MLETTFAALAEPNRFRIVELLRAGAHTVTEIGTRTGLNQPQVSKHLRVLKDAGLVSDRKEGRWSYYAIVPDALAELHDVSIGLQPSAHRREMRKVGRCC